MSTAQKSRGSALTAWLGTLDAERLRRVLEARPDAVAAPEPRTPAELADRLQRPRSVLSAVARLPLPCLQVAEAAVALGTSASRRRLTALLQVDGPEADRGLTETLETLADHALLWPGEDGTLHQAGALRQVWSAPLGLEPPLSTLLADATSEELRRILTELGVRAPGTKAQRLAALVEHHASPERIAAVLAEAPAPVRRLLEARAKAPARPLILFGSPAPAESDAKVRWAVERGLLVRGRYSYGPARMPAEVAVALRGAGWRAPFTPTPPVPRLEPVSAAEVERETAAAAGAFGVQAAAVLAECAERPPAQLKSGGIGARELARLGKTVRCEDAVLRLVLECAQGAGLLARDGDRTPVTAAYDAWAESAPADQVACLVEAWWRLPFAPTRSRDGDGKALPALAGPVGSSCEGCVAARHGLLTALAGLPSGQGVARDTELAPLIEWHRPLADQLLEDTEPFAALLREARLLGVQARGTLSPLGRALLDEDGGELRDRARALLPQATDSVRIGSDLTAVVTGVPSARLSALLDAVADREAHGTASVWRLSADSLRRAWDAGRDPASVEAELAAAAGGALPQALGYLISDTARRHGHLRVAGAGCVIHGADPGLLAEIAAHRALAKLGLRQLAPTVLVGRASVTETLTALRARGYAPVAEGPDGTVRIERAQRQRAAGLPAQRATAAKAAKAKAAAGAAGRNAAGRDAPPDLGALASRLLTARAGTADPDPGDAAAYDSKTEETVAAWAKQLTRTDIRQLAHAIDAGREVVIHYVSGSGAATTRTVSDLDLDPPFLYGWCHLRSDDRVFTLSRIEAVMPA